MRRLRAAACFRFLVLLLGLSVVSLFLACGKKGPPTAPDQPRPAPIESLTAEILPPTVTLRWVAEASAPVAEYGIYRAATALGNDHCTNCPLLFQKQGHVKAPAGHTGVQFSETVEPGFRYAYKVRPYFEDGRAGPYSNVVTVQVP